MTPEDAARVLEPIWQGFAAARCRLAEVRERVGLEVGHGALAQHVGQTQDAEAYLAAVMARFLCPESGGLLTVIDSGRKVHGWPNAHPAPASRRAAEVRYFARRYEAEIAAVQPLRVATSA